MSGMACPWSLITLRFWQARTRETPRRAPGHAGTFTEWRYGSTLGDTILTWIWASPTAPVQLPVSRLPQALAEAGPSSLQSRRAAEERGENDVRDHSSGGHHFSRRSRPFRVRKQ